MDLLLGESQLLFQSEFQQELRRSSIPTEQRELLRNLSFVWDVLIR